MYSHGLSQVRARMRERESKLFGVSSHRVTDPVMKATPQDLITPQGPTPSAITWGAEFERTVSHSTALLTVYSALNTLEDRKAS